MKFRSAFLLASILALSLSRVASASQAQQAIIPTFAIVSVVAGQSVTIQTADFPPSLTFTVTMGKIGTRGVGGIVVDTTDSGNGGSFTATYAIPTELQSDPLISIRLENPEGWFSYNWFFNTTSTGPTDSPVSTPTPQNPPAATTPTAPFTIPTFTITSVIRDQQVSIETANFPPGQTFSVLMGLMGTRGLKGTVVDTIDSGNGGSFVGVFAIPPEMAGQAQIAVRLQSSSGFFSYNWFYNTTTP